MTDDEEYCARCGDAEFDEDGNETHADEDEYDHDFEYEEEEGTTLEDVKEFANTVKSLAEAGKAVKELTHASSLTKHPELNPDKFKQKRFESPPPQEKPLDLGIAEHPDAKDERRHKQNIKLQKIAIVSGVIIGISAIIVTVLL